MRRLPSYASRLNYACRSMSMLSATPLAIREKHEDFGGRSKRTSSSRGYIVRQCLVDAQESPGGRTWFSHHLSCSLQGRNRAPRDSLLLTCRQVYKDAALLTFSTNNSTFLAPRHVDDSLCSLTSEQAAAIKEITLRHSFGGFFWTSGWNNTSFDSAPQASSMTFAGVKCVNVLVDVSPIDTKRSTKSHLASNINILLNTY